MCSKLSAALCYLPQSFGDALKAFLALFILRQLDHIEFSQDPRKIARFK
jgi:hypothetical protein